ncbi:hypothetical protein OG331_06630 [Streptomyces sp. NBC_01017]|uniref:Uncharacterized protein n=1 Tax=Streptomyces machairae TaxID=3134109 RepID=A0ABU8UVL2_9ACTN|nr:hypothetical protein OG331_06630 [Streptomyces sp. NBC_01017]
MTLMTCRRVAGAVRCGADDVDGGGEAGPSGGLRRARHVEELGRGGAGGPGRHPRHVDVRLRRQAELVPVVCLAAVRGGRD